MNRKILTCLLSFLAAGLLVAPAQRALADDDSDEMQIEIQAPLDAAACEAVPPTITVLGFTIDVTDARFEAGEGDGSENEGESESSAFEASSADDEGEDQSDDGEGSGDDTPATCADLLVGSPVEVKLASDAAPLAAVQVEQEDGDEDGLKIKAPIQAVDPALGTITLLGVPVDITTARVEGSDDEDDDVNNQGIDPTTLMAGQFVEVTLDRNVLPDLVAVHLEVKNFTNSVEVEIEDSLGNEVDDVDDDGQPLSTVTVSVTQSVRLTSLQPAAKGSKGSKKKGQKLSKSKRTLQFQAQGNGRVVLHGLAAGKASVSVTRESDGSTAKGRGSVKIAPNSTTTTVIRLKGKKLKR